MAAIVWSNTYTDGNTLTGAQLEATKTDVTTQVNGNLDSANIASGSINNDRLANPNGLFCIPIAFCLYHDALEGAAADPVTLAQFQAARVGVTDRLGTTVDLPIGCPVTATIVSLHTSCLTSTGTNNARLRLNGADVTNSTVAFTTGTLVRPSSAPTGTVQTTDTLLVRVTLSGGANDGVVGGTVLVWLQAAHRAS